MPLFASHLLCHLNAIRESNNIWSSRIFASLVHLLFLLLLFDSSNGMMILLIDINTLILWLLLLVVVFFRLSLTLISSSFHLCKRSFPSRIYKIRINHLCVCVFACNIFGHIKFQDDACMSEQRPTKSIYLYGWFKSHIKCGLAQNFIKC